MAKFDYDLRCFKRLRQEMYTISYNMYPFFFQYNEVHTFAALYVVTNEERIAHPKLKYVLFRLIFMKQNDLNQSIECFLNSNGICDYNHPALREFVGVRDDANTLGNYMNGLCDALVHQCPEHAYPVENERLIQAERYSLCRILNLDPNHCYPLSIMRLGKDANGNQRYRDPNKFQLALLLMPHAARLYGDNKTITYCFTNDEALAVDEAVAIRRFTAKNQ